MNKITEITRRDIFDIIKEGFMNEEETEVNTADFGYITRTEEVKVYMPFCGRLDEIEFLSRLYDLDNMPSTDSRFDNAQGDIWQHTINNDDWDGCWFLSDNRFNLAHGSDDEYIMKFMCEILHPAVRVEKSPWKQYLEKFNELLRADGYELYEAQYISGRAVYKAREYQYLSSIFEPKSLFSERYKELIDFGNGEPVDNISDNVDFYIKKKLCAVMYEFIEPILYRPNRYDNWTETTNALAKAIQRRNEMEDFPVIHLDLEPCPYKTGEEHLASHFTPHFFDVIELQYDELSTAEKITFQEAINHVFSQKNSSFTLTDRGLIEQMADFEVLDSTIIEQIESISEIGVKELLITAVELHMQPTQQAHKDAVEKIWDALERLKTYYTEMDKKASATKIVADMSGGQAEFNKLFESEFFALTNIGNNFRIRHHETDKVDITDIRHYDYFFNRCLSLIALALQYLE